MPAKLKFNITGLDETIAKLEELHTQLNEGPGDVVMAELGLEGMDDIEERFETRGYGTWAPLSPITIFFKGHDKVLIDTGTMRDSVGIAEITSNRVAVTVPHGGEHKDPNIPIKHQQGDILQLLPERPIVEVTDRLLDRFIPVVQRWLGKAFS